MQGASSSKSYPSSSSETPPWKYDVFVSFSGEEARKSFADHLFAAMGRKGIISFRDDETLERGRPISQELFRAIEESRFSVVIFSRNYATSTWCLDAVAKIVECMKVMGQTILPVFYHVDPSDVRKQKGSFEDAFAKHQEDFKENARKVEKWRDALTDVANLSGWDLRERRESEVIQEIVERIFNKVCRTFSSTTKNIVGIDSQVKEVISYLELDMDDTVRIVGICGMGGIGKTTLAKVLFDKFSNQFEGSSFLANIREAFGKSDPITLQNQLLSEVLMDDGIEFWSSRSGANMIKSRLCHKKILLVLDDVDRLDQLKTLAGEPDWFGAGSRIIITARDEHLLITHGVDKIFKLKEMNHDKAHQLFCLKAFKRRLPLDGYMELSNKFVNYTKGLPLALEVLGSLLFGRSIEEWESALNRLKEVPNREILDVLRISYDGLEEMEKKIFLDIASFFKGKEKDRVVAILDSCGFNPVIGIRVLIDKSLITVSDNKLWMHDMLQEMGRGIIYQESPEEPCKRSRLWRCEDVEHMLVKDKGMDAVEVIIFDDRSVINEAFCSDESNLHLNHYIRGEILRNPKAFSNMSKLRLLKVKGGLHRLRGLEHLSKEIRFFEWFHYPLKYLPSSFPPNKIVEISICGSNIKSLWTGIKVLEKLKFINLKDSHNLIKTPDFTGVPNLERLVLENCTKLVEVHPSISSLKKLTLLNLNCCFRLRNLPRKIEMESLEVLVLSWCKQIKVLPEFGVNMTHLSELRLDGTGIRELPLTLVKNLTSLHLLDLSRCEDLVRLPVEICGMTSLKKLKFDWCLKLQELPENMGDMECLEVLDVSRTAIRELPSSITLLKNLKVLSFCGLEEPEVLSSSGLTEESAPTLWYRRLTFRPIPRTEKPTVLLLPSLSSLSSLRELNLRHSNLSSIPNDFGSLSSLTKLNLSGNNFSSLPESISQLSKLTILNLESCRRLRSLPELPLNIQYMKIQDCTSLEASSDLLKLGNLSEPRISCINCFQLVRNKGCNQVLHDMFKRYIQGLSYLRSRFDIIVPGSQIPKWFNQRCAGDRVVVQLPRDFREATLVGFALCTVFLGIDHLCNRIASNVFFGSYGHELGCHIKMNGHSSSRTPIFWCKEELDNIDLNYGSQHLWLLYLSRHYFGSTWQNNCNHIEFSFEVGGPGLEVVRSGACVVYEEDVENFHRPMITLSGSSDINAS